MEARPDLLGKSFGRIWDEKLVAHSAFALDIPSECDPKREGVEQVVVRVAQTQEFGSYLNVRLGRKDGELVETFVTHIKSFTARDGGIRESAKRLGLKPSQLAKTLKTNARLRWV